MNEWSRLSKEAEYLKAIYPPGTRILLQHMEDPYSPIPEGTRGTVEIVDDIGQLHMSWDNGRTLAVVPGVDSFRKLSAKELDEERKPSLEERIQAAAHKVPSGTTSAGKSEVQRS